MIENPIVQISYVANRAAINFSFPPAVQQLLLNALDGDDINVVLSKLQGLKSVCTSDQQEVIDKLSVDIQSPPRQFSLGSSDAGPQGRRDRRGPTAGMPGFSGRQLATPQAQRPERAAFAFVPPPSASPFPPPSAPPFPVPSAPPFRVPSAPPFRVPSAPPFPVPSASPFPVPSAPPFPVPSAPPFPVLTPPTFQFYGLGKRAPSSDYSVKGASKRYKPEGPSRRMTTCFLPVKIQDSHFLLAGEHSGKIVSISPDNGQRRLIAEHKLNDRGNYRPVNFLFEVLGSDNGPLLISIAQDQIKLFDMSHLPGFQLCELHMVNTAVYVTDPMSDPATTFVKEAVLIPAHQQMVFAIYTDQEFESLCVYDWRTRQCWKLVNEEALQLARPLKEPYILVGLFTTSRQLIASFHDITYIWNINGLLSQGPISLTLLKYEMYGMHVDAATPEIVKAFIFYNDAYTLSTLNLNTMQPTIYSTFPPEALGEAAIKKTYQLSPNAYIIVNEEDDCYFYNSTQAVVTDQNPCRIEAANRFVNFAVFNEYGIITCKEVILIINQERQIVKQIDVASNFFSKSVLLPERGQLCLAFKSGEIEFKSFLPIV